MRKIKALLLCLVMLSSMFAFGGCKEEKAQELSPYDNLINIITQLQLNASSDDDVILISGTSYSSNLGTPFHDKSYPIQLNRIIIATNALFTLATTYPRYYYFSDIESISKSGKIVWQAI